MLFPSLLGWRVFAHFSVPLAIRLAETQYRNCPAAITRSAIVTVFRGLGPTEVTDALVAGGVDVTRETERGHGGIRREGAGEECFDYGFPMMTIAVLWSIRSDARLLRDRTRLTRSDQRLG